MGEHKRIIRASVIGLMTGVIAGWAVEFGGAFIIVTSCIYGAFVGELILKLIGRRSGGIIVAITGLSIIIGAIGGRMVIAAIQIYSAGVHPPYGVFNVVVDLVTTPVSLIAVIAVISCALLRMRYSKCGDNV